MNGLHAALDELVTDVPEYGDLDRAIAQADEERRRRYGLLAGLVAAAAVLIVIAGILSLSQSKDAAPPPVAPTPTPSTEFEAPGPQDHPVALYDAGGALVVATLDQVDRPGTATLWRRDSGRWQKLGKLEQAYPLHLERDSAGTSLKPGPGEQDIIAMSSADEGINVSFSRDGGATWTQLARPCTACYVSLYGDDLYAFDSNFTMLMRTAFGTTAWEELSLPPSPGPRRGFVMDDDTLIIEDSGDCVAGAVGHYRVSRDFGDTWSERRALPGSSNCITGTYRNTVYAHCNTTSCYYDTGGNGGGEGTYRSTDLVHWEPVRQPVPRGILYGIPPRARACPPGLGNDPVYHWVEEPPLRIGDEVFKLFHVNNRDGREHVLMVSRDDCRTWRRLLR